MVKELLAAGISRTGSWRSNDPALPGIEGTMLEHEHGEGESAAAATGTTTVVPTTTVTGAAAAAATVAMAAAPPVAPAPVAGATPPAAAAPPQDSEVFSADAQVLPQHRQRQGRHHRRGLVQRGVRPADRPRHRRALHVEARHAGLPLRPPEQRRARFRHPLHRRRFQVAHRRQGRHARPGRRRAPRLAQRR